LPLQDVAGRRDLEQAMSQRIIARWVLGVTRRDSSLSSAEIDALEAAIAEVRTTAADEEVVGAHEVTRRSMLLLEGWAYRSLSLEDGRRQILALHVPGDFVDMHSFPMRRMDHAVTTLTPCRFAVFPHARLVELTERHPHLARLLWLGTLIDAAILRRWLLGVGQRSALEHAAHLICELYTRLSIVGLANNQGRIPMPLTQAELGDVLGISGVHANRVVQGLRASGAVAWRGAHIEILDWDALQALAQFDPDYLNLYDEPR
jgi:CRP-like cAMP-binding protein